MLQIAKVVVVARTLLANENLWPLEVSRIGRDEKKYVEPSAQHGEWTL